MATDSRPSDEVEGSWSPRRTKAETEQPGSAQQASTGAGSRSQDPEVLASEIEKTRAELAETLDAIADKVSPKRVAQRTGDSAKETASEAVETVKAKAADVSETVKAKAADLSETIKAKAAEASDSVKQVTDRSDPSLDGSVPVAQLSPAATTGALADAGDTGRFGAEPAGAEVPPLRPVATPAPSPGVLSPPVLAGAAAAVLVVLVLLRRRRRS